MGKVRKFAAVTIKKLNGGRDPRRVIEEFVARRGFEPEKCLKEQTPDSFRWMIELNKEEELEVLLEGIKHPSETTIYMGVNILTVPLRGASEILTAALEIADGLVGVKISLVGHFLVLSASLGASGVSLEELDYIFRLLEAQRVWFRETLSEDLGWDMWAEQ